MSKEVNVVELHQKATTCWPAATGEFMKQPTGLYMYP